MRNPPSSELDVNHAQQTAGDLAPGLIEQSVRQMRLRTIRELEALRQLHREGMDKAGRLNRRLA